MADMQRFKSQVIPFRLIEREMTPASAVFRTGTTTFRPVDILLLAPVIIPVAVIVILLLLAWFILWLATVGLLLTTILIADTVRAFLRRLHGFMPRALDRRTISYQGR